MSIDNTFKITSEQYSKFITDYFNEKYPNQRLGQAFINEFAPMGYTNAKLFYSNDKTYTIETIVNEFVNNEQ